MTSRTDQAIARIEAATAMIATIQKSVDIQSKLLDNILVRLDGMGVVVKDINDDVNDLRDDMIDRR